MKNAPRSGEAFARLPGMVTLSASLTVVQAVTVGWFETCWFICLKEFRLHPLTF